MMLAFWLMILAVLLFAVCWAVASFICRIIFGPDEPNAVTLGPVATKIVDECCETFEFDDRSHTLRSAIALLDLSVKYVRQGNEIGIVMPSGEFRRINLGLPASV